MPDNLDDLLLRVADQDTAAISQLCSTVQAYAASPMPSDVRQSLLANVDLYADAIGSDSATAEMLVCALAAADLGHLRIRDAFADLVRRRHSEYPDPAGLIRGLGVLDEETPMRKVMARLNAFGLLQEGVGVWHDSYGLGKVTEIDAFSDLVYIEFQSRQQFNLQQTLSTLSICVPDSDLSALRNLSAPKNYTPDCPPDEFDARIAACMLPPPSSVEAVVEAILVPDKMSKRDFDSWRQQAPPEDKADNTPVERSWHNARSLDELAIYLKDEKQVKPNEAQAANLQKVFLFAAPRANMIEIFSQMITELWKKTPDKTWLTQIIGNLPEDTAVFGETEDYHLGSKALAARDLPFWFAVTHEAKGAQWLVDQCMGMPLRYWAPVEAALKEFKDEELLFETALESMRKGTVTADAVAWLWKKKDKRTAPAFANPQNVFRILAQDAKGEYIKARKDVLKLMLENETFQKAMMDNGSRSGIDTFVKTVQNMPLLNKGEQQSVLVKICRLYPDARELVENRARGKSAAPPKRHMPKLTAERSYRAAEAELKDIINVQIPENAQAISTARDYGDLRENAEFKAAKERQAYLGARRAELEEMLKTVRPTHFDTITVEDVVIPGSTVELQLGGKTQTYHLLGLWDSDPEKKILSYDTPLGKSLIGKKVGDSLDMPNGDEATVSSINELPQSIKDWIRKV